MTTRRKTALVVLAGTLGAGALLSWKVYRSEPVYEGKPLSAWARQYGSNHWSTNQTAAREAEVAIQHIGSDAVPFLLDEMRTEDNQTKTTLRKFLPRKWHDKLRLKETSFETRSIAACGMAALGTNVPPPVIVKLIEIATHHPDENGRFTALYALRLLGPTAEPAIPFLIECLTNASETIRGEAAMDLGAIGRQPQIAVPALMKYIESASGSEASDAIACLAKFGSNAKPAVPLLLSLINHKTLQLRFAVTNYLPAIDPEAAGRAGFYRP